MPVATTMPLAASPMSLLLPINSGYDLCPIWKTIVRKRICCATGIALLLLP